MVKELTLHYKDSTHKKKIHNSTTVEDGPHDSWGELSIFTLFRKTKGNISYMYIHSYHTHFIIGTLVANDYSTISVVTIYSACLPNNLINKNENFSFENFHILFHTIWGKRNDENNRGMGRVKEKLFKCKKPRLSSSEIHDRLHFVCPRILTDIVVWFPS